MLVQNECHCEGERNKEEIEGQGMISICFYFLKNSLTHNSL